MNYENMQYSEMVSLKENLKKDYEAIEESSLRRNLSFDEFINESKEIREKIYFLDKYIRLKQDPVMTYGKEWNGDIFTTEKFIKYVEEGYFIDEDGFGYYATKNAKSDVEIYPSDITEKIYRKDFSHIIWFNR